MLRWLRRVMPCTAIALLTLTTPAAATCAWVLWARNQSLDPPRTSAWEVITAVETRPVCLQHPLVQSGPVQLDAKARPVPNLLGIYVAGSGGHEVSYECLPDTIDPRGPKGK